MRNGHVAITGRDVEQFLRRIEGKRVDTVAIGNLRDDLAGLGVHNDRGLAATGEDTVRRTVDSDSGWSVARSKRPDGTGLHRLGVDDLDLALVLETHIERSLAIARSAFRNARECDIADDLALVCINHGNASRVFATCTAVILRVDAIGAVIVHDAVETL